MLVQANNVGPAVVAASNPAFLTFPTFINILTAENQLQQTSHRDGPPFPDEESGFSVIGVIIVRLSHQILNLDITRSVEPSPCRVAHSNVGSLNRYVPFMICQERAQQTAVGNG